VEEGTSVVKDKESCTFKLPDTEMYRHEHRRQPQMPVTDINKHKNLFQIRIKESNKTKEITIFVT
jgi:hypothetical protein